MPKLLKPPANPERDRQFDQAFQQLGTLFDPTETDDLYPVRGNAVYTTCVVLWMLVYQRMQPDKTLEAAIKYLLDSRPTFVPKNKRLQEKTLSLNTSGYSDARQRLPLEAAQWFARRVSQSLIEASTPTLPNRRAFLLDGTALALAPEPALQKAFPPAPNQKGPGVWPMVLVTVAHELNSGVALNPELGPKYGPNAVSETALGKKLMTQMPKGSIVLADAGFGIFGVAHAAVEQGLSFSFRLTALRFRAYRKRATKVEQGVNFTSYECRWTPSKKDLKTHPEVPKDAVLNVRLHEIVIHKDLTLYLVSDLGVSAKELAALYKCRVNVEIDIRNLKVVLNTEQMRATSVAMFEKELMMSMVAYNLVSQFRRQAAELGVGRLGR